MKLTKRAYGLIRSNVRTRHLLALALDVSVFTIDRYLDRDSDNLTKAAALQVIREETGLEDAEILEESIVGSK